MQLNQEYMRDRERALRAAIVDYQLIRFKARTRRLRIRSFVMDFALCLVVAGALFLEIVAILTMIGAWVLFALLLLGKL